MTQTKQLTPNQQAFQEVFNTHFWGNRNNAGKRYVRPYHKSSESAHEYMVRTGIREDKQYAHV